MITYTSSKNGVYAPPSWWVKNHPVYREVLHHSSVIIWRDVYTREQIHVRRVSQ
jgi:hypothetical protein